MSTPTIETPEIQSGIPNEFFSSADPALREHITICSIYPKDLRSHAFCHGRGIKYYDLKSGSMESPSYCPVYNTYTNLRANSQIDPNQPPPMIQQPISALAIANDLVKEWGGDHPANRAGFIGISIIVGDRATPVELGRMKLNQENFFKAIVANCDSLWMNGKRDRNYDEGRRAAEWLGIQDHVTHPWYPDMKQHISHPCPFCRKEVDQLALGCSHCSTDLVEFHERHKIEIDAAMWPEAHRLYLRKHAPAAGAAGAARPAALPPKTA